MIKHFHSALVALLMLGELNAAGVNPPLEKPVLEVAFDEPFSDNLINAGDDIPVFAGCEAHIDGKYLRGDPAETITSPQGILGVGFKALIENPDSIEKLEWWVEPGAGNKCIQPRIIDQYNFSAGSQVALSESSAIDATNSLQAGKTLSAVVVEYTYATNEPSPNEFSAKAGDQFTVHCKVTTKQLGENGQKIVLRDQAKFHITPGKKAYHVAIDSAVGNREQNFVAEIGKFQSNYTAASFEQAFKDYNIMTPVGSAEQKMFIVYCFDRFRNPLDAGEEVAWRLNGSGTLGEPGADSKFGDGIVPGDATAKYTTKIGANGRTEIKFTQTKYPTCPFSPDPNQKLLGAEVEIGCDDIFAPAGVSVVSSENFAPVAQIGKVILKAEFQDDDRLNMEFGKGEYVVSLNMEYGNDLIPLKGIEINLISTNGTIKEPAITDNYGSASPYIYADGAQPGNVEFIANFGGQSVLLTRPGTKWVTERPHMIVQREIIAGNRTTAGSIDIEVLEDKGESLIPGAGVEGDGILSVPVYPETDVEIVGVPNHVYTVFATSSRMREGANAGHVEYAFDSSMPASHVINGYEYESKTISDDGQHFASHNGAKKMQPTTGELVPEGLSALEFDKPEDLQHGSVTTLSTKHICISDSVSTSVLSKAGTGLSFYYSNNAGFVSGDEGVILKSEKMKLVCSHLPNGLATFLFSFQTNTGWKSIESVSFENFATSIFRFHVDSLPDRVVFQVEQCDRNASALSLSVRTREGLLRGKMDGKQYLLASGENYVIGNSNIILNEWNGGAYDYFAADVYDYSKQNFDLVGLTSGTITTDGNGKAKYTIRSRGLIAQTDYLPDTIDITATGSESFTAKVYITTDWFKARLIACGKAALKGSEGLGSNSAWYEKASAWASEVIPFASDVRTIGFEVYKAATGCDKVDGWNVGFAVAGLVIDTCTLGTGKALTGPLQLSLKGSQKLLKAAAKQLALGIGIPAAAEIAINGYVKLISMKAAAKEHPDWENNSNQFLETMSTMMGNASSVGSQVFFGAMGSVSDIIEMSSWDTSEEGGSGFTGSVIEFMQSMELHQ